MKISYGTMGFILILIGIFAFVTPMQMQITSEYGDFSVDGTIVADQGIYTIKTRSVTISFIPSTSATTGENLVKNPSFESDSDSNNIPDSWVHVDGPRDDPNTPTTSYEYLTGDAYDGQNSVKATIIEIFGTWGSATWVQDPDQYFKTVMMPGTTYKVRCAYKTDTTGQMQISLRFTTYEWNYTWVSSNFDLPISTTWRKSDFYSFTTPSGQNWTDTYRIRLFSRLHTVGSAWVDDWEIYEASASYEVQSSEAQFFQDDVLLDSVPLTQQSPMWMATYTFPEDGQFQMKGWITLDGVEHEIATITLNVDTSSGTGTEPSGEEEQPTVEATGSGQPTSPVTGEQILTAQAIGIILMGVGFALVIQDRKKGTT